MSDDKKQDEEALENDSENTSPDATDSADAEAAEVLKDDAGPSADNGNGGGTSDAAEGSSASEAASASSPESQTQPQAQPQSQSPAQQEPAPVTVAAQPQPAATPEPQRSNATPIAWLALLLVLVVAAGTFYSFSDLQRREGLLLQRVQGLESVSGQDTTTFDQMRDNLQRQIELELEGVEARQRRAEEDQQRAISRIESLATESSGSLRREFSTQIQQLQQSQREQAQRIGDLTVDDRESWQLAEVQYLLRLANQRLIMTGDTQSAEALLRSADNILRSLDDTMLRNLRAAVAEDLAAIRAVPKLDTQGLYLRLDALIRQTDALVLFELPEREAPEAMEAPEDWQDRLAQGYEMAIAKLSEYIVVSRTDVPVETLMDPQYEGLVRQNMRMLLEQAQVAMLSGNEVLYRQSLERAEGWVTQFFKADESSAAAMADELRLLRDERVSVTLPELTRSLAALDAVMDARLARTGG